MLPSTVERCIDFVYKLSQFNFKEKHLGIKVYLTNIIHAIILSLFYFLRLYETYNINFQYEFNVNSKF